jgi:hypothetical protein
MFSVSRAVAFAACFALTACVAGARRPSVTTEDVADDDLSPPPAADLGVPAVDLATSLPRDLAAPPPRDLATATPDLAPRPDLASSTTVMPASCTVRINELATGTTTSGYEEFIELYNPCASTIDLHGFSLELIS